MDDDRYTIEPMNFALIYGQACFRAGDLIDVLTGATIVGSYCSWPKQEPRRFIVTAGKTGGKTNQSLTDKMLLKEFNKDLKKKPEKFYQKLNVKKW